MFPGVRPTDDSGSSSSGVGHGELVRVTVAKADGSRSSGGGDSVQNIGVGHSACGGTGNHERVEIQP